MYFVNENIGFVVGYNGDIYKTIDSGSTWRKQNSGTILHLHSVYIIDENVGFVSSNAASGCHEKGYWQISDNCIVCSSYVRL